MIEKIGPIKNPLTIIAIFAAIAEISGTIVLPFIAPANQAIYVWFLIIFPILLIILFFLTLNFNHKVLYAPSDYQNEDNFLRSLPRATLAEKALKIEEEIAEDIKVVESTQAGPQLPRADISPIPPKAKAPEISIGSLVRKSPQAKYMFVEEAIFRRLAKEFGSEIQREVKVGNAEGRYIFDGIVRDKGITTVIEVKYLRSGMMPTVQLRHTLARIQQVSKQQPLEQAGNFRVLLALAVEGSDVEPERVQSQINRLRDEFSFPIEVRFYRLDDLERDFIVAA